MTNSLDDVRGGKKKGIKKKSHAAHAKERERERRDDTVVSLMSRQGEFVETPASRFPDRFVTRPQNPIKHWIMIFTCADIQQEVVENRNESPARTHPSQPPLTKYFEIERFFFRRVVILSSPFEREISLIFLNVQLYIYHVEIDILFV